MTARVITEGRVDAPSDAAAPHPAETRRRLVWGAVGLVAIYVTLGFLHASALPPFLLVDESAHVGYALTVADFELPTIDTPIPADGFPVLQERLAYDVGIQRPYRTDVWSANHPPLFYLLTAAPLHAGVELGRPLVGLWAARALNVLLGAGVIVATVALARLLVPARPSVALLAGGWLATVPIFTSLSAAAYNDVLAALTATGALVAAVKLLSASGSTFRAVAAVALWSGAAALTRVSGLLFAAVAAAVTAVAAADAPGQSARVRLRRAARDGGGVVVVVALAAGWFYWRNVELYGGLTGRPALLAKVDGDPGAALWQVLTEPWFWGINLWDAFGGILAQILFAGSRFGLVSVPPSGLVAWLVQAAVVTAGVALVLPPLLRVPALLRRAAAARGRPSLPGLATWALLAGTVPAVVLASAEHVAQGGNPHGRYLVQVLPLLAITAAMAWMGHAGRPCTRRWALPALGLAFGVNLVLWLVFVATYHGPATAVVPGLGLLAAVAAIPGAPVLLPLAGAALPLGVWLYVAALRDVSAHETRPSPPRTAHPEPRSPQPGG